jgi:hypothetical protein
MAKQAVHTVVQTADVIAFAGMAVMVPAGDFLVRVWRSARARFLIRIMYTARTEDFVTAIEAAVTRRLDRDVTH